MKPGNMAGRYYYHHNNEVHGPVEFAELNNQVFSGFLEPNVSCCKEGSGSWVPFHDIHKIQSIPQRNPGSAGSPSVGGGFSYEKGRQAVTNAGTFFIVLSYLSFVVAGLNLLAAITARNSGEVFFGIALGFLLWGLLALFLARALTALAFAVFDIAEQTAKR